MVKQERAARTRRALVRAAAAEFDQAGYEGTSLARVSKAAGISMGALTFHFPTKEALAHEVAFLGQSLTRAAVELVRASPASALQSVIAVTLKVAGLLETETAVRAAARLTREHPGTAGAPAAWTRSWVPVLTELLERARENELRPGTDPETIATLAVHLVAGAEAHIRCRARTPGSEHESADAQLAQIWRLVLRGISPAAAPPGIRRQPLPSASRAVELPCTEGQLDR